MRIALFILFQILMASGSAQMDEFSPMSESQFDKIRLEIDKQLDEDSPSGSVEYYATYFFQ